MPTTRHAERPGAAPGCAGVVGGARRPDGRQLLHASPGRPRPPASRPMTPAASHTRQGSRLRRPGAPRRKTSTVLSASAPRKTSTVLSASAPAGDDDEESPASARVPAGRRRFDATDARGRHGGAGGSGRREPPVVGTALASKGQQGASELDTLQCFAAALRKVFRPVDRFGAMGAPRDGWAKGRGVHHQRPRLGLALGQGPCSRR